MPLPAGKRFFDQYSVICVFGSVVGCVVVPLLTQVSLPYEAVFVFVPFVDGSVPKIESCKVNCVVTLGYQSRGESRFLRCTDRKFGLNVICN